MVVAMRLLAIALTAFLELLGRDAVWVSGVVAALIALSTIAGNTLVELFTRVCGRRTTLLLWAAAVMVAATVGVGLAGSFWTAVALLLLRRRRERADMIVGRRAGQKAPCAGQGLPVVATVDTTARQPTAAS